MTVAIIPPLEEASDSWVCVRGGGYSLLNLLRYRGVSE